MNDLVGDVMDMVRESVVVTGADGRVVEWNRASEALYGWSRAEAVGRDRDELLGTGHGFGLAGVLELAAAAGSWRGELLRVTRDGRRVRIGAEWRVRDGGGVIERGQDADALAEAAVGAELTAHRYRNLFNSMAASFWELDFSDVRRRIGALFQSGVTDLRARLAADPAFVDDAIAATGIIDVNETTVAMFGAPSRGEVLSRPIDWAWPAESRAAYAEALVAAVERRGRYTARCRLRRWDGSLLDALFTVCWPEGHEAQGAVLVGVIDLTEQVRAFHELSDSEARFRTLFERVPVAVGVLDNSRQMERFAELAREGVADLALYYEERPGDLRDLMDLISLTDLNPEGCRLLGMSASDMPCPTRRFWGLSPETFDRAVMARLRGEPVFSEETTISTADGTPFETLLTIAFSTGEAGRTSSIVGFVDIGPSKRAMAALAVSEGRYRDLFRQIPLALWRIDTRGMLATLSDLRARGVVDLQRAFDEDPDLVERCMRGVVVVEVNAATMDLCAAANPAELVGRDVSSFWRDDPTIFRDSLAARFRGEASFVEEGFITTGRGRVPVSFGIAYPPAGSPEPWISVISTLDIADRKRAEARVQRAQADLSHAARVSTLGELSASIAHEVNQPLAAIGAYAATAARWLQRPEPDVEELRFIADQISADARRASDIIARIRRMAQNRTPDHVPLDLAAVVGEALLLTRHELAGRSIRLRSRLPSGLPPVRGDRVQLQQVVVNLVLNAAQALGGGTADPSIRVIVGEAGDGLRLEVADNGPGIPGADVGRLFDGFFTTKEDGMGLGLAICRSIVEAHGGVISAGDAAPGATLRVELPRAAVD